MEITINDHRKIFAIQDEFQKLFPNYKLEFFGKPSRSGGTHAEKIMKPESKTIGECRSSHTKGNLTIAPNMTVSDLKQSFNDVYELKVEVLKKSEKGWTTTTGDTVLA
jgi:hypothetical protein